MRIRINRVHHPVLVLGYGRRAGVWTQGCGIGCAGCVSRDTWDADPDTEVDVTEVVRWCASRPGDLDGVTISGGEPFDQPDAFLELLDGLNAWRAGLSRPVDLLAYSGRSLAVLRARFGEHLARLDAVIPGPFVEARAPGNRWRGSANQELVPLTPLGHERYDAEVDRPAGPTRLQLGSDGERVYHIGVPAPGDLNALEAALARRGLAYEEASWRS
ncbi:4Fe-4S cluster-binding domain-containing protein [Paractinoplanes atraurantiacus]|uniref:Anaerobic ribonucleoside-triphosphate reductase activating protein n=1 Tax=Paractinoplanes atraurantiacus TaxID=1036182 RepID=A0A285JX31_9ACTN|nr:4Fe-4S cluster-binding domain-containing protein [Actinoplanes atraurantiacus]SNY64884.1 anaerobic ribonucleoside-triphosphate reductase activating protein [Actinoplanes atraurantiacus]